jgi:hypothetical protein
MEGMDLPTTPIYSILNQLLSLGHVSIKTTKKYLGVNQSITDAPCDKLCLKLDWLTL